MGLLIKGEWCRQNCVTTDSGGEYQREDAGFRNWITADGSPGPSGDGGFKAEANRYHLYVSLACPWAHRTLIFRKLKGLEELIPVSIVSPLMLENGWTFDEETGSTGDALYHSRFLYQLYQRAQPDCTGWVTVPVLWDKKTETIVSNESAEIIRMFNSSFNDLTGNYSDFYPKILRTAIDKINKQVYIRINNGVYKCGFATTQSAYEYAYRSLFSALDKMESILSAHRYLTGEHLTEADWRLFTTLIRFDSVYHGHFKANRQRLVDYPNLFNYLLELYQYSGIAETVDFDHIKRHYYYSHDTINPNRIVPVGPEIDFTQPHNRAD